MSNATNQDSWSNRVNAVATAIGITPAKVIELLTSWGIEEQMGIEMLDDDEVTKFGDFQNVFGKVDDRSIPLAKLRLAFKFLKGGKKAEDRPSLDARTVELKSLGIKFRPEDAPPAQLFKLYDPSLPGDPITNALKKRFGDKKVVAFKETGEVAVDETVAYVNDLEQSFPEQDAIMVDGSLSRLWPVGVKPDMQLEEDPLFPGQPLRQSRSIVNHRNWSKVEHKARQLCRIILDRSEVNPRDTDAVLRLIERAEQGFDKLKVAYPAAELNFKELAKEDQLPRLKISNQAPSNNPFGGRTHRRY